MDLMFCSVFVFIRAFMHSQSASIISDCLWVNVTLNCECCLSFRFACNLYIKIMMIIGIGVGVTTIIFIALAVAIARVWRSPSLACHYDYASYSHMQRITTNYVRESTCVWRGVPVPTVSQSVCKIYMFWAHIIFHVIKFVSFAFPPSYCHSGLSWRQGNPY